jgi:hypothetical protein
VGVDSSPVMVEISTERASARGSWSLLPSGMFAPVPLDAAFDRRLDQDCILYAAAGEQRSLWERLGSVLVPNGQLFVTDFCRGEAPPSPEFTRHISECQ